MFTFERNQAVTFGKIRTIGNVVKLASGKLIVIKDLFIILDTNPI